MKTRFWNRNIIFFFAKITGLFYKTPMNLSYWWSFGALALYFLILQIITGIFLAMFYNPSILIAFKSIMFLNNEIYYGWWLRALHANGASFFFFCTYLHMFRGLYYGSFLFPRQFLWNSGVLLFILMIITAFLGYVLPWGQMSFWAAMVITSLLAAIPFIGSDLIFLIWGGFSIEDATLHRFYSLHFTLPFVILLVVVLHVAFLHEAGSSNPLGISSIYENVPFSPYYILKDILSILGVLFIFFAIIYVVPDMLGHTINYQRANFLVTPPHIVPEWYLLFFYAILRSVPSKLLGFFFMVCSLLVLFFLPYLMKNSLIRSTVFKPWHKFWFWIFVVDCILLSWIGGVPVLEPFLTIGRFLSFLYFFIILVIFPLGAFIEKVIYDSYIFINKSI
jgi:quinol-cytochrome oxidoreductase complex cytochrome b subunit